MLSVQLVLGIVLIVLLSQRPGLNRLLPGVAVFIFRRMPGVLYYASLHIWHIVPCGGPYIRQNSGVKSPFLSLRTG